MIEGSPPASNAGGYKARIGWHPRPEWGTVRNYIEVPNDIGGIDIACKFIFDDGSGSAPLVWHNSDPIPDLGEYARGVHAGDHITIKVSVSGMNGAENVFNQINGMDAGERALMFMDCSDIHEDCGWAWTHEYRLVKSAPGLIELGR